MVLRTAALGGLAVAGLAAVAAAAPSQTVTVRDARGDARSTLDVQRASLKRTNDGRLEASMTMAAVWDARTLLANDAPPGSVCVRIWTGADADPAAMPPDRLVCVTAKDDVQLEGAVLRDRDDGLPEQVATASVSRPTQRSVRIRFSQRAIGRPARLRAAFEATRPGCFGASCVDRAPDGARTVAFRLQ
jgi:hypothetical protein